MNTQRIKLSEIRTDGGTQPRAAIDRAVVEDYAEQMGEGAEFPAVVAFYDGKAYWLADGFHRIEASNVIGFVDVDADVRQGTRRDAVLFSVGANQAHGLRRTNADKRRAVETLLADEEWGAWSNREVARRCGVGEAFIRSLRTERSDEPRTYTTKHGTVATMNTANIGKASKPLTCQPNMTDSGPGYTGRTDAPPAARISKPIEREEATEREAPHPKARPIKEIASDLHSLTRKPIHCISVTSVKTLVEELWTAVNA